jgi:hypothetical protein
MLTRKEGDGFPWKVRINIDFDKRKCDNVLQNCFI